MIKLSRYIKPYAAFFLVAVVLLFGQAISDLNLPNMMSNIVNVGIQKSGIEEVAPKAVSPTMFALLERFMSAGDKAAADAAYTPYEDLTDEQKAQTGKTFPDTAENNAMVLTAEGDALTAAEGAFGRADTAFVNFLQKAAEQSGKEIGSASEVSASFDLDAMEAMLPMLAQVPDAALQGSIEESATSADIMASSIASVFNKAIYQQLGADTGAMQTAYIVKTGLLMLLFSLFTVLCAVGAGFCFARLGAGVARDLRRDVFNKVTSFTNAELDKFSTASLITRTTNDVTQVQMLYTMGMRMLVYAPVMGVGGVIMALRKSVNMSWIIALAVLVIICVIGVLYVVAMPRFKRMQKFVDRLNLVSREKLSGLMVIRAFGNQQFQEKRFEEANDAYTKNSLFIGRAFTLMFPVMMLVMNGVSLLIIWIGGHQIADATMQVGDMMAYLQYAMQVIMSFLFIAMIFVMVPQASVSAERIDEVLRSESAVKDPKNPKTLGHRANGVVEFKNVSFRYEGAHEDVLHDISFTARPGETTAFIGSTGSGKSTVVNLIPRFYDVSAGSVTLDGVDVRELTQHELRDNIGYVPQKGLLFSGNIDSNLRYGDENADGATLRKAAEVAQATEFIDSMEDGFESPISQGGTNVSGGQRQRLSIARALVKRAPVYIFDDSFSALDFKTDARLRAALKPYTRESSVLIVAQRVATIMHAEQIVVLNEGRVAGIGTHRELLATCPPYREIAESQLSEEELA